MMEIASDAAPILSRRAMNHRTQTATMVADGPEDEVVSADRDNSQLATVVCPESAATMLKWADIDIRA